MSDEWCFSYRYEEGLEHGPFPSREAAIEQAMSQRNFATSVWVGKVRRITADDVLLGLELAGLGPKNLSKQLLKTSNEIVDMPAFTLSNDFVETLTALLREKLIVSSRAWYIDLNTAEKVDF